MLNIFDGKDIVINTPAIEDYIHVVEFAMNNGVMWMTGEKRVFEEFWYESRTQTCLHIVNNRLRFDCAHNYLSEGYCVLSMQEFYHDIILQNILK